MIYFNLIPAVLVIGAYFLGHYVGRRSRDIHFTQMVAQNAKLKTMLDFAQAENEHVAGMLKQKVAMAHAPIPPPRTDPITEWPLRGCWSAIPDSMNNEVLYGIGQVELMRESQDRCTAAMRRKLDELVDRSPGVKWWDRSVKCVACERTIDLLSERPQDVFAVKCQCGHLTDKPA